MPHAVAATHAVIWYVMADRRLSSQAKAAIDNAAAAGNTVHAKIRLSSVPTIW